MKKKTATTRHLPCLYILPEMKKASSSSSPFSKNRLIFLNTLFVLGTMKKELMLKEYKAMGFTLATAKKCASFF